MIEIVYHWGVSESGLARAAGRELLGGSGDPLADPALRELLDHLARELAAEYLALVGQPRQVAAHGGERPRKWQARA